MAARDLKNLSYSHYSDCLCVGNIRQAQYKVYAVRGADWKDMRHKWEKRQFLSLKIVVLLLN